MAQAARLNLRMQKELKLLLTDPPPSASFPTLSDDSSATSLTSIDALLQGPKGTVYANGVFKIKIQIPERYPFQPPIVTFATPIYHPNIDNGGRICLDILNLPPKGMWQPSLNISTVLTSIGLLLSEPNPDDGLMHEASRDYKYNRQAFDQNARSLTEKHARAGEPQSARGSHETHTGQNTEKEFIAGLAQTKLEGSGVSMPGVSVSMSMPTTEHRKLSLGSNSNQMYKVLSHDYSKKDTPLKEANDVCTGKLQAPRNNKLSLKVSVRNEGSSGQNHLIIDEKENLAPVQCGAPQLTNQTCTKQQQQQINRDCSAEAVIVLDSEDSEDEIVPVRSKLSLAKRCCLSRKRKSAH